MIVSVADRVTRLQPMMAICCCWWYDNIFYYFWLTQYLLTAYLLTRTWFRLHAWFLPRDAMRKRGLGCRPVSVCLSVRHSVRHVGGLYPDGWRYR